MKASLLVTFLLNVILTAPACAENNEVNADALTLAQSAVSQLQDQVSAFDMSLVEPLNSLADQQMRFGQFDLAFRTLDRAAQIVRINQGLFTPAQYPLLHKKVDSLVGLGNWDDARTQLDYLVYLYTKKQKFATEELLTGFRKLSDTHLRAISEDEYDYQGFHFSRVSASNWIALAIGEALWGDEDPRLVPLIYKVMSQFYLEYAAINRSGRTGIEIRTVVPGSGWVRDVSEMRQYYLSAGRALIERLEAIYSTEANFDQEALAMIDLYLADWYTLFNYHEEALSAYSDAYESLVAANLEPQNLNQFLGTPRLLPEPIFYPSLSLASQSKETIIDAESIKVELGIDPEVKLFFVEWSGGFPYVQQPLSLGTPSIEPAGLAIFSFNIGGFPDIERLLQGRRPLGFGVVEDLRPLTDLPENEYQKRQLIDRVSSMRFRPKLVKGVPHQTDATLFYAVADSSSLSR